MTKADIGGKHGEIVLRKIGCVVDGTASLSRPVAGLGFQK